MIESLAQDSWFVGALSSLFDYLNNKYNWLHSNTQTIAFNTHLGHFLLTIVCPLTELNGDEIQ